MKKFLVTISLLAIVAGVAWTQREHIPFLQKYATTTTAGKAADGSGGGPKDQHNRHAATPSPVKTVAAALGTLPNDVTATGWASAEDTTTIAAQEEGTIVSIDAQDGAMMKTGDLIAKLDARTAQAAVDKDRAMLAKDQSTLTVAESALTRAQSLLNGAGTQQTVDQARAARDAAAATVDGDRAQLAADQVLLEHTEIRAPFDGRLGDVTLSVGAFVSPGTAIVTIAKYDPIYVKFHLQEAYLRQLKQALAVGTVKVSTVPRSDKGKPRDGQITFYDNTVDPASGTILAKARFENADGSVWPGQSVNLVVHFNSDEKVIVVPTVAVAPGPDGFYAFVVGKDSKVRMTPVTVARANGGRTAISNGLSEGDHVVVEGQVQLTDGQAVTEQFSDQTGENLALADQPGKAAVAGEDQ
ncbi:efflux RND transporter periplasmic adaptor subunit [Rhizobium sp. RAF56]|jgi:RND family efflux transporter MFP subunit|uniref:efflux RND transporter periplasmic adaptor subunit n=1 Tax=Rhizobium sp. RAF56 TaxID=3233062 RepID=UPI003F9C0E61